MTGEEQEEKEEEGEGDHGAPEGEGGVQEGEGYEEDGQEGIGGDLLGAATPRHAQTVEDGAHHGRTTGRRHRLTRYQAGKG